MNKKLIIFGNGEIADLAHYYFTHDSEYEVVAFVVDDAYVESETHLGLPLVPLSEADKRYPPEVCQAHVALSYQKLNRIREDKYTQMKALGYTLVSYVCSKSVSWPDLNIGDNCFILENQTIQPTVTIGNNVMIWSGNHLGHNCSIGDHTYISSHVVLCGHTKIGKRCFLGVNAAIKDFVEIGDDVFVAMGADIVKNMESGGVALGAKSTLLAANDGLAIKLRNGYFGLNKE